jgi:hypothetical protein
VSSPNGGRSGESKRLLLVVQRQHGMQ